MMKIKIEKLPRRKGRPKRKNPSIRPTSPEKIKTKREKPTIRLKILIREN